jgi:site-specific recombinase XerC
MLAPVLVRKRCYSNALPSVICGDGEGFANSMGYLLQTRQDVMRIAALVLYQLSARFNIDINPRHLPAPESFAGVHLRTSSDATAVCTPLPHSRCSISEWTKLTWQHLAWMDEL